MSGVLLRDWILKRVGEHKVVLEGNRVMATAEREKLISQNRGNPQLVQKIQKGHRIQTSNIIWFDLENQHAHTQNSIYQLKGPMDMARAQREGFSPAFLQAFADGIPPNWESLLQSAQILIDNAVPSASSKTKTKHEMLVAAEKRHTGSISLTEPLEMAASPPASSPASFRVPDLLDYMKNSQQGSSQTAPQVVPQPVAKPPPSKVSTRFQRQTRQQTRAKQLLTDPGDLACAQTDAKKIGLKPTKENEKPAQKKSPQSDLSKDGLKTKNDPKDDTKAKLTKDKSTKDDTKAKLTKDKPTKSLTKETAKENTKLSTDETKDPTKDKTKSSKHKTKDNRKTTKDNINTTKDNIKSTKDNIKSTTENQVPVKKGVSKKFESKICKENKDALLPKDSELPKKKVGATTTKKKAPPILSPLTVKNGKVFHGRLKDRRKIRTLLERNQINHADDLMSSTPLKKKKIESIDLSEDEEAIDFFANASLGSTPSQHKHTNLSGCSSSSSLCSPLDKLDILKPFDRDEIDVYINRLKNKTYFQSIKSDNPLLHHIRQATESRSAGPLLQTHQNVFQNTRTIDQQLDYESEDEDSFLSHMEF